jgi:drug/metabolite transporter (DMT)-like permease
VSLAAPVISMSALSMPVLVGVALGERPSALALVGIGLAVVAFPMLSRMGSGGGASGDGRHVIGVSLASGVLLGGFLVTIARVSPRAGLGPLLVARLATVALFAVVLVATRGAWWPPAGARRLTLSSGLLDSFANIAYVVAIRHGPLALIGTIISLSPATTTLLARVVLRERWSVPQRAGLVFAAASIVCISLG